MKRSTKDVNGSRYIALLAIVTAIAFAVSGEPHRSLGSATYWLSPVPALIAFFFAVLAVARAGFDLRDRISKSWIAFMVAMFLWFLSEVAWSYYPLVLNLPTPFPSLADLFGLGGYAPTLLGLLSYAWPFREILRHRRVMLGILSVGVAALAVILLTFSLMPLGMMDLVSKIVGVAYPILDVVVLALASGCYLTFEVGTYWRPFRYLIVGIVLALAAHIISAFVRVLPIQPLATGSDVLLVWGYFAASIGFFLRMKQVASMKL